METRANYVLVGVFVLICVLGLFVATVWLAGSQYREEYAFFRTYFTGSVTGLGEGTIVRYNGIDVGRVTEVAFDETDPRRVIATLQIDPTLRLHVDSVASLESQGLTGVTYVEIEGGTATSPLLTAEPGQQYPMIPSKPSTLQLLARSGPEMIQSLKTAGDRFGDLLNDENRGAVAETLENLRTATSMIDSHAKELDAVLMSMKTATDSLNRTLTVADSAIVSIDRAVGSFQTASESADTTLQEADIALQKIGRLSDDAAKVVNGPSLGQFTQLMAESRALVASIRRLSNDLEREPTRLLFGDQRQGYTPQ